MRNINIEAKTEKITTTEEERIQELITKCMTGSKPTAEEQQLLEHWYDTFPDIEESKPGTAIEYDRIKSEIKTEIFKQINQQIPMQKIHNKRRIVFPELWVRVATAILVLILMGGLWSLFLK